MDFSGDLPRVLDDLPRVLENYRISMDFSANRQSRQMIFWVPMILGDEAQAPWWIASPISPPRLCKIILISTNCWVSTCDFLHYFRVSLLDSHHSMPDSNHFYICFLGFSCMFFWIFLDFLGDNPCSVSLSPYLPYPNCPAPRSGHGSFAQVVPGRPSAKAKAGMPWDSHQNPWEVGMGKCKVHP